MARRKKNPSEKRGRSRPGRRTTEERRTAVMEVMSGKASVDQVAERYGVLPETVEGWRQAALEAVEEALRFGPGGNEKNPRERELEQELKDTRHALTESAIQVELLKKAVKEWGVPTGPARFGSSGSKPTRGRRQ